MNLEKLITGLKELGFAVAYSHFAEGNVPESPYVVVNGLGSEIFQQTVSYIMRSRILTSNCIVRRKIPESEKKIADFLTEHKIYYEKEETYIDTEKKIQVIFEI